MITIKPVTPIKGSEDVEEWELGGYLTNLRGDNLKQAAADLGLTFKSKTPVSEIREAIRDHYLAEHEKEHIQPEQPMIPVLLNEGTGGGKSEMSLTDIQRALMDEATANLAEAEKVRTETARLLTLARTGKGAPMPLHWRGRAQGAKHHKTPNQKKAEIREALRKLEALNRVGVTHKPNSERVSAYETQNYVQRDGLFNYGARTDAPSRHNYRTVLSHRQMRRVRKNANRHQEHFTFDVLKAEEGNRKTGHSLLARTPDGMGIFYRFVK